MLLKPLMLGIAIDFGLLAVALTLRFIILPLYLYFEKRKKIALKNNNFEKIVEIKIEEIKRSNHSKHYLKI